MANSEDDKRNLEFILPRERFEVMEKLGEGSYGIVMCCKDLLDEKLVAVKQIINAFENEEFAKRTLREIRILRLLRHENIIGLKSVLPPISRRTSIFGELYLVFELMETDLASIIKSPQPLSDEHIQFFLYQILRGLKYVHSADIIHRDLKPRNLLVNSNCDLKICDFGLAKVDLNTWPPTMKSSKKKENLSKNQDGLKLSDYVATRWYRAPELTFEFQNYGKPIDMWAVGCILAELMARNPFFPGKNRQQQIELFLYKLGKPKDHLIDQCKNVEIKKMLETYDVKKNKKQLHHQFRYANIQAIDLLRHLLEYDPEKRYTVEQALKHPYLSSLHCEDDEPKCNPVPLNEFEYELVEEGKLTMNDLRILVGEDVYCYYEEYQQLSLSGSLDTPKNNDHHHQQTAPRLISDEAFTVAAALSSPKPKIIHHNNEKTNFNPVSLRADDILTQSIESLHSFLSSTASDNSGLLSQSFHLSKLFRSSSSGELVNLSP